MERLMKKGSLFTWVLSLCNAKYNFLYKYIKWEWSKLPLTPQDLGAPLKVLMRKFVTTWKILIS